MNNEKLLQLISEWNDERSIYDFSDGSGYKANWLCPDFRHQWNTQIRNRTTKGIQCHVCSGYKILAGFNDLGTIYPHLQKEWDSKKNAKEISEYSKSSSAEVYWVCRKQKEPHSYLLRIDHRIREVGCPYCSGKKVLIGFNDLGTTHPHLINEWVDERAIDTITAGSHYEAKWKCPEGHVYQLRVNARTRKYEQGCSYCTGRKVLKGHNDLGTTHPHLIDEWADERDIETVSAGSEYVAKWQCSDHKHSYSMMINNKCKGQQCSYCAGKKVQVGFNDLGTTHPHLVDMWADELKISEFSKGSEYLATWKCDRNHNWKAMVSSIVRGCPSCSHIVSNQEIELNNFIVNELNVSTIQNTKSVIAPYELDTYIPEKNIAIEFNGLYWHSEAQKKDKNYHYNKYVMCKEKGIQLIQIWEDDWLRSPDLIKKMVSHKLGRSDDNKTYARKTIVDKVKKESAMKFSSENHIQGYSRGEQIGLRKKDTGELVALSTWRKNPKNKSVYLDRFCTVGVVPGGFSKLLKYAATEFKEEGYEEIVTFADHSVSNGALYENNGFIDHSELKPDYSYMYKGERKHKFGFRIKKFKNSSDFEYREGHTEKQLADLNGLLRIWDAGKTRYVLDLNTFKL